jgi:hypothetical protein
MKSAIMILVVATAVGGAAATGYAQEKLKAASPTPPAGTLKPMPLAGSASAQAAEAPQVSEGASKIGQAAAAETGLAQPNTRTEAKASQE